MSDTEDGRLLDTLKKKKIKNLKSVSDEGHGREREQIRCNTASKVPPWPLGI